MTPQERLKEIEIVFKMGAMPPTAETKLMPKCDIYFLIERVKALEARNVRLTEALEEIAELEHEGTGITIGIGEKARNALSENTLEDEK